MKNAQQLNDRKNTCYRRERKEKEEALLCFEDKM